MLLISIYSQFSKHSHIQTLKLGFCFSRDPYGIATKRDKILAVTMIVLAVLSNSVALYSDAMNIFRKKEVA
jgi:sodium-coupled neutral amino acid transporter 2